MLISILFCNNSEITDSPSPEIIRSKFSSTVLVSLIFFPPDIPNPYLAAGPVKILRVSEETLLIISFISLGLAGKPARYLPGT